MILNNLISGVDIPFMRTAAEEVLVWKLQYMKDQDYEVPSGQDPYRLVLEIMEHLGSPDAELRDELGYRVLSHLIFERDLLTAEQLREVLDRALSTDLLFDRIGETETNSVFGRSFASLVIALVLLRDNQKQPFLTAEELQQVIQRLVAYTQQEADFRGFVPGCGWAHAPAHVSDAIDECVRNRHVGAENCAYLWQGIRALVHNAPDVYDAEEDERFSVPLAAMVETGKVSLDTLCDWLEGERVADSTRFVDDIRRMNWKHVIRSLYFRLRKQHLLGQAEERLWQVQEAFTLF